MPELKKEKFTLRQMIDMNAAINAVAMDNLPAQVSYRLACVKTLIKLPLDAFEAERVKLARKHGASDRQAVPSENLMAFNAEVEPLLNEPTELSFAPTAMSELAGHDVKPILFITCQALFND